MVTIADLRAWKSDTLTTVADDLQARRTTLTEGLSELEDGAPPGSWTFDDAAAATATHADLTARLELTAAEISAVVAALDSAATTISAAQELMIGTIDWARANDLHVDETSGMISYRPPTQSPTPEMIHSAEVVQNDAAVDIGKALSSAAQADADLAAVLQAYATADSTDPAVRAALPGFLEMSDEEKARYLLDNPDQYDDLLPYLTQEQRTAVGQQLAAEVDAIGQDPTTLNDPETVARLNASLEAMGQDPTVMSSFYDRLGPDGLVAAQSAIASSMYVGVDGESLSELAINLRDGLVVASNSAEFDAEDFGRDMVRYALPSGADHLTEAEQEAFGDRYPYAGGSGASVLDFMLREGAYSEDFVKGATWELDEFERAAGDMALSWYSHSGSSPLDGIGLPEGQLRIGPPDPMASAFGQLSRFPGLGLEFFTQITDGEVCVDLGGGRQEHYFNERDWRTDGYQAVSELALAVGTDETNLAENGSQTAFVVSSFVDGLAANEHFSVGNAQEASPAIGQLLGAYVESLEHGITTAEGEPGVRLADDTDPTSFAPRFNKEALDEVTKVAVSTASGAENLAAGVGVLEAERMRDAAGAWAGADDGRGAVGASGALQQAMEDSGALRGYLDERIAATPIENAEETDARIKAFASVVSDVAGWVKLPGADDVGYLGAKVIGTAVSNAISGGETSFTDAYASNTGVALGNAEARAMDAANESVVRSTLLLAQSGVVDLPAGSVWYDPSTGELRSLDWIVDNAAVEDYAGWATPYLNTVGTTDNQLRDAYAQAYQEFYNGTE